MTTVIGREKLAQNRRCRKVREKARITTYLRAAAITTSGGFLLHHPATSVTLRACPQELVSSERELSERSDTHKKYRGAF